MENIPNKKFQHIYNKKNYIIWLPYIAMKKKKVFKLPGLVRSAVSRMLAVEYVSLSLKYDMSSLLLEAHHM